MGDPLNYLLELGFTLDEVETLKSRNDFTCQQMADAAKAIVDRGGTPLVGSAEERTQADPL